MSSKRDRDSRRADREKIDRLLVGLGHTASGRSLYRLIQDRLGKKDAISRSAAYRAYNGELIDRSTRQTLERALGVSFEAIELHDDGLKLSQDFVHAASYSGPVWIHVKAKPENKDKVHRYTIRWGPWQYAGILTFKDHQSASLLHMKGDDGQSVPIFFRVSLPCCIEYGFGDPPAGPVHDINHGWSWIGNAAMG